ncbi:hypothetical protein KAU33_03820 [Candidatus Dependentiae bacterium]|nr:hypothetical protein [Candidatus Dependentiae bacterium]
MTKTLPCQIYYDTRGFGPKAKEYKDAIRREFPNAEEKFLEVGDLICGNAGIELKTVPDFLASISDGRLKHQPVHLKENFTHPMILILGSFTDILAQNILNGVALKSKLSPEELEEKKQIKIHENSIFGALTSIVVRHKISVMLLEDLNIGSLFNYIDNTNPLYPAYVLECMDFAKLWQTEKHKYIHAFRAVHYFIEKANDGKPPSDNIMRRTPSVADQQVGLVSQLPGVSGTLSVKLLTEFNSIQNLFNQNPEALMEVDKIGPIIADHIHELVTRKFIE